MRPAPCSSVVQVAARRTLPAFAATALLLSATPGVAPAALVSGDGHASPPASHIAAVDSPPAVRLPSARTAAAARASGRWILTAHGDAAHLRDIARRHGGRFDATLGALTVRTGSAHAVAEELGARLATAGPDLIARRFASFDDPGGVVSPWSREQAGAPSIAPPSTSLATIGVVDDAVDKTVSELSATEVINGLGPADPHGTMVGSTAAAPYDGTGVVGVAPGARLLSWGTTLSCSDVSTGITQLVRRGARVINLSLGFDQECSVLEAAVQFAYASGTTIVSASGNDADRGNPLSFPASYEHVITAAALTQSLTVAAFSNYDDYVDVAAPGVAVPVDVPLRWDTTDGVPDGRTTVSGTSFASPFIAGGVSWILGARPELDPGQVAAVLRQSTRDLEQPGWDPYTGYGLLQIGAAMAVPTPPKDFLEPNDAPPFVRPTGRGIFSKPPIWKGGAKSTIRATGDSSDDNIDAYRVKVPAGARVKVQLQPSSGRADLFAFDASVRSFLRTAPIDASTRSGTRTDTIWIRNTGRAARYAFVVVNTTGPEDARGLSEYALAVRRD